MNYPGSGSQVKFTTFPATETTHFCIQTYKQHASHPSGALWRRVGQQRLDVPRGAIGPIPGAIGLILGPTSRLLHGFVMTRPDDKEGSSDQYCPQAVVNYGPACAEYERLSLKKASCFDFL